MFDYKFLGSRIRAVRIERKMTQEKLAEAAGVGVTHISHIETGNSIPSLQTLVDIINALGCTADELLCMEVRRPALDNLQYARRKEPGYRGRIHTEDMRRAGYKPARVLQRPGFLQP